MQASLEDSERMGGGRMHRPPCRLPRLLSDELGGRGELLLLIFPFLCVSMGMLMFPCACSVEQGGSCQPSSSIVSVLRQDSH